MKTKTFCDYGNLPGNCPIHIGYHDTIIPFPQVNPAIYLSRNISVSEWANKSLKHSMNNCIDQTEITTTCCFPSIAVENVNVMIFPPSFRPKDAICTDVGVMVRIFFLMTLCCTSGLVSVIKEMLLVLRFMSATVEILVDEVVLFEEGAL